MNKMELVEAVAGSADVSKAVAKRVLDGTFQAIAKTLKSKGKVNVTGFGTFLVSKRQARTGRNPQTGATMQIPAMSVPRFKAGKGLKESVR